VRAARFGAESSQDTALVTLVSLALAQRAHMILDAEGRWITLVI
jgi:hypothetical protein